MSITYVPLHPLYIVLFRGITSTIIENPIRQCYNFCFLWSYFKAFQRIVYITRKSSFPLLFLYSPCSKFPSGIISSISEKIHPAFLLEQICWQQILLGFLYLSFLTFTLKRYILLNTEFWANSYFLSFKIFLNVMSVPPGLPVF